MSNTSNTTTANRSAAPGAKNLVETAAANGSFTIFSKALRQAGMADALCGVGPFTVFAPTDAAFSKLPAGRLDSLLKPENKAELAAILNYHVLAGSKDAAALGKLTTAKTENGASTPILLKGSKLSIDGASVTVSDIASSNGVLHGIDKVNMPTKH